MTTLSSSPDHQASTLIEAEHLDRFCRTVLIAAGADEATADTATRAMMHGSLYGLDSHGVRLLDHYVKVLVAGRVNPRPKLKFLHALGAVAVLDADNGHGALAAFSAMDHAVQVAKSVGICAVAIRNTSHFGPAGAYALAAAKAGCLGLVVCNTDSFVRLHDGTARFHGTNPIACAAPIESGRPWLLDMATSAIPYNRVLLNRGLGINLPPGVASADDGADTQDPAEVKMLAPLGAAFGYKGAGLAGFAEILSAVLAGMKLSFEIAPMGGPDLSAPRTMGAFVLAIHPDAFIEPQKFKSGMDRYLGALRKSPAREGAAVLAPGDREWAEAERRQVQGIPVDPTTEEAFKALAARYDIALPLAEPGHG